MERTGPDALLSSVIGATLDEIGLEAERQLAAFDTELSCEPSAQHTRTMEAIIDAGAKVRKRPRRHPTWLRVAACLALVVFLGATVFRSQTTAVWRWLFRARGQDYGTHTEFTYFDRREWMRAQVEEEGWVLEDILYPVRLPDGYFLDRFDMGYSDIFFQFTDEENKLQIQQCIISPNMFQGIDTEDAVVSTVKVGDYEAMLIEKRGWATLYFHDDTYTYMASANGLDAQELIELIAHSL